MNRFWLAAPALALTLVPAAPAQSVIVDGASGQVTVNGQVIRWGDWADGRPRAQPFPGRVQVEEEFLPEPLPGQWPLPRRSTVIQGSANGFGNSIVVENGGFGRGTTVIENSRNGVGNSIVVENGGRVIVDGKEVPPARVYRGKDNDFWNERRYDDVRREWHFHSPRDRAWFRYDEAADCYRQLPPAAPVPPAKPGDPAPAVVPGPVPNAVPGPVPNAVPAPMPNAAPNAVPTDLPGPVVNGVSNPAPNGLPGPMPVPIEIDDND